MKFSTEMWNLTGKKKEMWNVKVHLTKLQFFLLLHLRKVLYWGLKKTSERSCLDLGFAEEKSKNQKNKISFTHVNMVNTGQELSYDHPMFGILVYVLSSNLGWYWTSLWELTKVGTLCTCHFYLCKQICDSFSNAPEPRQCFQTYLHCNFFCKVDEYLP